jgi:hypothetical protein
MLQQGTIIFFGEAGSRAFRFSCFAGSFSGNARQVTSSGRSFRSAVKVTGFNKLPLQSLPVRPPTSSKLLLFLIPYFVILLFFLLDIRYSIFDIRYWILDIGYWILDFFQYRGLEKSASLINNKKVYLTFVLK